MSVYNSHCSSSTFQIILSYPPILKISDADISTYENPESTPKIPTHPYKYQKYIYTETTKRNFFQSHKM